MKMAAMSFSLGLVTMQCVSLFSDVLTGGRGQEGGSVADWV